MTTYYSGSSALAGARSDLGNIVGKWWDAFGVGEESQYIALRATVNFPISKAGAFRLYGKDWVKDEQIGDLGNEYKKQVGEPTPKGKPASVETADLDPMRYGKAAVWDEDDATIHELMEQGGLALVEEVYLNSSLAMMAQGLDYDFKIELDALTLTGRTAAATAAQWSTASSGLPVTHLSTAILGFPRDPDTMIISRKSLHYMLICDEWTDKFGGTVGIGRLSQQQIMEGLATFGIYNLYIGDTDIYTDAVYLAVRGGSADVNPVITPAALVRGTMNQAGADERGVVVKTWDDPDNAEGHNIYASIKCDFHLDADLIGSVTDIY